MDLIFTTTNINKIKSAQLILQKYKINVIGKAIEVDEIQSHDPQKVIEDKLRKSYQILQRPLISMDSGLFINGLKGFPGVMTKYALETIGEEGFVNLVKPLQDKSAYVQRMIGFTDGKITKFFISQGHGEIVSEKVKTNGYGYDNILFVPSKNTVLADLSFEDQVKFWGDAWDQLGQWLANEYSK